MPTNRKRLVVPTLMGAGGFEVLKTRDDVEVVPFAPTISSPDFLSSKPFCRASRKLLLTSSI